MIKKSFRLMLLAAFALSSVMFVSCNKWEDDINELDEKVASLEQTVQSLKAAVDAGSVVTSVSESSNGITFTLSNGKSYVVKHGANGADGKDGVNGTNGVDGKSTIITIDPETNNWIIDGVDTGICAKGAKGDKGDKGDKGETGAAGTNGTNGTNGVDGKDGKDGVDGKDGKDGKSPYINEAGNWVVWNDETQAYEETQVSAKGATTYVVDCVYYWQLNVMEKVDGENAEFVTINLPKTAMIVSVKAVSVDANNSIGNAEITLAYGAKLTSNITFNGQTYYAGENLVAAGSTVGAIVNPTSVDASLYEFSLIDSKGNAPYVLGQPYALATEGAITKAATANVGMWAMSVELSDDLVFAGEYEANDSYAKDRSERAYALVAKNYDGSTIMSAYDIKVTEQKKALKSIGALTLKNQTVKVGETLDLRKVFGDNFKYVKAYYFTMDQIAADAKGVTLNGNEIVGSQVYTATVKVNYLLVDGTKKEGSSAESVNVAFTEVAPEGALQPIKWVITNKTTSYKQYYYMPIPEDVKSLLVGSASDEIPSVKLGGTWTWANGDELDDANVVVSTVAADGTLEENLYGTDGTSFETMMSNGDMTVAKVNGIYRNTTTGTPTGSYKDISNVKYVRFEFDYETVFPGEYANTLEFRKADNSLAVVVPIKVVIEEPEFEIARKEAFFDGDDVTVYGTLNNGTIEYNLASLFSTSGLSFEVTPKYYSSAYHYPWLTTTAGNIEIDPFDGEADNTSNTYQVNATNEFTAHVHPFGNKFINAVSYTFNATAKTPVSFDYVGSDLTIKGVTSANIYASDFVGLDLRTEKDIFVSSVFKPVYDAETGELVEYNPASLLGSFSSNVIESIYLQIPSNDYITYNCDDADLVKDGSTVLGMKFKSGDKTMPGNFVSVKRIENGEVPLVSPTNVTVKLVVNDYWGITTKYDVVVTVIPANN